MPAVNQRSHDDFGQAQSVARKKGRPSSASSTMVQATIALRRAASIAAWSRRFGLGADQPVKQCAHRRPEGRKLPIHPALDKRAACRRRRIQPLGPMGRREIAADRVRFPQSPVRRPEPSAPTRSGSGQDIRDRGCRRTARRCRPARRECRSRRSTTALSARLMRSLVPQIFSIARLSESDRLKLYLMEPKFVARRKSAPASCTRVFGKCSRPQTKR